MEEEASETTVLATTMVGLPCSFVVSTACKPTQRRVATDGTSEGVGSRRLLADGGDESMVARSIVELRGEGWMYDKPFVYNHSQYKSLCGVSGSRYRHEVIMSEKLNLSQYIK